jgi:hypothetical protein
MLDFEKIDDLLANPAMRDLLVERRAVAKGLPEQAFLHAQIATRHDVVERRHALEQRDVLKRPGDALARRFVRAHSRARLAAKQDAAGLRLVEAVDDVEHRGLAGAVGADDGADFPFSNVEGDVRNGLHPAERERNVLEGKKRLAVRGRMFPVHAARLRVVDGWIGMSMILDEPTSLPLRPSS